MSEPIGETFVSRAQGRGEATRGPEDTLAAATELMGEGSYREAAGLLLSGPRTEAFIYPLLTCSDGLTSDRDAQEEDITTALQIQRAAYDDISAGDLPNKTLLSAVTLDRMVTSFVEIGDVDSAVTCIGHMEVLKPGLTDEEGTAGNPDTSFYRRALAGYDDVIEELQARADQAREDGNDLGGRYLDARAILVNYLFHPPPVEDTEFEFREETLRLAEEIARQTLEQGMGRLQNNPGKTPFRFYKGQRNPRDYDFTDEFALNRSRPTLPLGQQELEITPLGLISDLYVHRNLMRLQRRQVDPSRKDWVQYTYRMPRSAFMPGDPRFGRNTQDLDWDIAVPPTLAERIDQALAEDPSFIVAYVGALYPNYANSGLYYSPKSIIPATGLAILDMRGFSEADINVTRTDDKLVPAVEPIIVPFGGEISFPEQEAR